jgi:two-component system OmpR family sensor kinase
MTLRVRLVVGLVAVMTAGLALFGWVTYSLYSRSEYDNLDSQLRSSVPLVRNELARVAGVSLGSSSSGEAGIGAPGPAEGGGGTGQGSATQTAPTAGPDLLVPPGTYGELIDSKGAVVSHIQQIASNSQPKIPRLADISAAQQTVLTVGSINGSSQWRTYVSPVLTGGYRLIVAVPTSSVTNALHRLLLIEVAGGFGLLILLSAGAGLVLRRGLAPIERMASTADRIAAGELSARVSTADPSTEVGTLGLALNTMLDEIETAFEERDATEDRLRQFLADASHELKTPLTSIQGFAELFRLGSDQPGRLSPDPAVMMRRIEEASARMKVLVDDLLLLARLDDTRGPNRAAVDLSVVAADACDDAMALGPDRSITLVAPEPVVVWGDEAHLRQAIGNLVTNAVRHTPAGTPIEVRAELAGDSARVEVRDHGDGLDDDTLIHAFERFWQKDSSRTGTGSGLGLAIVAAVASEHGGQASARTAPDGGAIFTLRLPIGSAAPAATSGD